MRKIVGEDRSDYAALAAEQEALATAHRSEAERIGAKARDLEAGAQAQAEAALKQTEAGTLRQAAAAHRTDAQVLDQRATLREKDATPWRRLAQSLRSRIVEPPRNFIQRLLNALYRAIADGSEARADAISAEAGRLRVQAEALREAADLKEQEAHRREAEATALLAEATEAQEEAAGLRTEADTFTAQAQAAEALAAEYRALAENPPAAQIATHYLYDPEGRFLGEYDEEGRTEREYVYLDGLPLAQITGTAIAYIHTDHLGTPESLTDQAQAIVWQAHHDPFGQTTVTTRTVEHNLRFPGQYFDAETGLHYNYFRDYDPGTGRYIQSDPIGLEGGINPFEYALNNPIRVYDPFGLEPNQGCVAACTVDGGILGGGLGYLGGGLLGGSGGMLVAPGVGTIGGAIGGADLGGAAGAAAGSAAGNAAGRALCSDDDREDECYEQYYEIDIPTCRGISRRRGKEAAARCYASAAERYAACLAGKPIPRLIL